LVETSVLVSALAGAGSFFSPCILPIVPAFVSYLSGTTLSEVQNQDRSGQGQSRVTVKRMTKLNIFLNTVYFVLGFSLVFAVLGVIFNSVLVNVGTGFQGALQWIGGVVIVVFGAYLILSTRFRQLNFERRMTHLLKFKTTYLTSFVFGAAFASGRTPCVGQPRQVCLYSERRR
jgi:cytochrome c-type biogenesis protein